MPSRSGYSSVDSSPSASESVQSSSLSYRRVVIPILGLLTFAAGLVAFKAADGADLPVLGRHKRGFELLESKPTSAPLGCHATVLIARHCEKSTLRQHCTPYGLERAVHFATLFGEGGRWPEPDRVVGRKAEGKKMVLRSIEMVQPLADKFGLDVEEGYGTGEKVALAGSIFEGLRDGSGCGKLTVVGWKHENIPKLADALGCGVDEGCPLEFEAWDFDKVWQIRYTYDKPKYSSRKSGKLGGPRWIIQASVVQEGFDALAWEKLGHEGY